MKTKDIGNMGHVYMKRRPEGDPIGAEDRDRKPRYVVLAGTVCAGEPPRLRAR